jgi:hypothetical protein
MLWWSSGHQLSVSESVSFQLSIGFSLVALPYQNHIRIRQPQRLPHVEMQLDVRRVIWCGLEGLDMRSNQCLRAFLRFEAWLL